MSKRMDLLRVLADGRFHSGEKLGQILGISRTAVWKHLQNLSDIGLDIYAVRGRGYRLSGQLELLDREILLQNIGADAGDHLAELEVFEELDSTNAYLMRGINEFASGHICISEQQTQGRGRRGRHWQSSFGRNTCLSLCWHFNCSPADLASLTLATGVFVVRALQSLGFEGVGLKWPNDIYCQGRKLGGILLEMSGEFNGISRVVAGVGINVHMMPGSGDDMSIDQPWTSLVLLSGDRPVSRCKTTARVAASMLQGFSRFSPETAVAVLEQWRDLDILKGKKVDLQLPDRVVSGIAVGVDDSGGLVLQTGEGKQVYHAGEVSVRISE